MAPRSPRSRPSCEMLGRFCASTAMIYAMHQIEVACLVRHGLPVPFFRRYLAELAEREWLIASATSEIGVGGDLRRSVCAVERDGQRIRIRKQAPVISYGEEADDILLTARRDPDAAPGDQVLVLVRKADTRLTRTGGWDTLGMRGTRSLGFTLEADGRCGADPAGAVRRHREPDHAPDLACLVDLAVAGAGQRRRRPRARVCPRRGAPRAGDHCRPARCVWPRRSPNWEACARPSTEGSPISSEFRTTRRRSPGSASRFA